MRYVLAVLAVVALLIVIRHRTNIVRLVRGKEHRFSQTKRTEK